MELNCIRLLVNDFDGCFKFYKENLKLTSTWGEIGGDYASFDIGLSSGLSLFKSDLMASAIGDTDKEYPVGYRDKIAIIIKVDDVDRIYNELKSNGVHFVNEPSDMTGWGMRAVHLRDPENNLLELFSELDKSKWDHELVEDDTKYNN
ncbi:MAG: glyoxalase [Firmicutes bacterium HGW-Firmicutes-1]|jgi:predicted enzyme related to lactoylglutathione lyase|nr:MAG: glyoxalase [Firmicutes bacterium HGW-Firmicutes-1]